MRDHRKPALVRLHFRLGWIWIAAFSVLGLLLEVLHGLKVGLYLDAGNETRRLMWTLAHAHGTLLGVLHIAFAATLRQVTEPGAKLVMASRALSLAGVLLPLGFFLGGIAVHGGDPGLGVALVPLGALALVGAALRLAFAIGSTREEEPGS
jgi:hypothetical protein